MTCILLFQKVILFSNPLSKKGSYVVVKVFPSLCPAALWENGSENQNTYICSPRFYS